MAFEIPNPLRIVCTKCPAVATVLYQDSLDVHDDVVYLAATCHGETIISKVDVAAIVSLNGGDVLWSHLRPFPKELIQERIEEAESRSVRLAERAAFFLKLIRAAG